MQGHPSEDEGRRPTEQEATGPPRADSPLDRAVRELERHVARGGWDGPLRVFALIRTARAMAQDPSLREQLPPDLVASADADPEHITSVEQEDLPAGDGVEDVLARISWPAAVDGAAVVVERFVVPPEAERDLPDDGAAALEVLLAHPDRQDVRLAVGVLREGTSSCALRTRSNDHDFAVGTGPDLAPGLVHALNETLLHAPGPD